ncbi:MAG: hypothetical protein KJS97_01270 [Alphaproteobacteria bacterium]|nr:hypothetical protein [Alphaproteobacteria bacterium]
MREDRAVTRLAGLLMALLLAGCATLGGGKPVTLDPYAERFVKLTLEIGEIEPGYVDAYHGPPAWAEAVKGKARAIDVVAADVAALKAEIDALPASRLDADQAKRRAYLSAHLRAAAFRLRMAKGERAAFADEAEALFGVRPNIRPLTDFDPALARIEALAPGEGPLSERVAALRKRYEIPADKLDAVMRAAIAECRTRTIRHIAMPAGEAFTLEFVTNKPWGGYNWYQGGAQSLIQVNVDQPVFIDRAVDLGCHEGYPGHHVHNSLLDVRLARGKGWVEFSVFPLFAPIGFIAEGTANAGIKLAFPGGEQLAFEQAVLYPLAGLDPATAPKLAELTAATAALSGAQYAVADQYLSGKIDKAEAVALLQKYQLTNKARAERSLRFIETYRSYIINYGLGREMAAAYIDKAGASQSARWAAMETILSTPFLPADYTK